MNFFLHFAAEAEHLEHVGHNEALRRGLGARYLDDFESTMTRICESPQRFRVEAELGIRIASLAKFPFFVIYREVSGVVQVLAIPHFRQRSAYWSNRVGK